MTRRPVELASLTEGLPSSMSDNFWNSFGALRPSILLPMKKIADCRRANLVPLVEAWSMLSACHAKPKQIYAGCLDNHFSPDLIKGGPET